MKGDVEKARKYNLESLSGEAQTRSDIFRAGEIAYINERAEIIVVNRIDELFHPFGVLREESVILYTGLYAFGFGVFGNRFISLYEPGKRVIERSAVFDVLRETAARVVAHKFAAVCRGDVDEQFHTRDLSVQIAAGTVEEIAAYAEAARLYAHRAAVFADIGGVGDVFFLRGETGAFDYVDAFGAELFYVVDTALDPEFIGVGISVKAV